jgi:hypothetical protein
MHSINNVKFAMVMSSLFNFAGAGAGDATPALLHCN